MRRPRPQESREAITFTVFTDVYARSLAGISQHRLTFEELAERIAKPREFPDKASMPLIKLGTFGDNPHRTRRPDGRETVCYRHDGNVVALSGLEGDYDGGVVPLATAAARLRQAGVEALLYTSPSHEADRPRWRVLAPLSHLHAGTPSELAAMRHEMMSRLQGVLTKEIPLASESWTLSQTYYVGRKAGAEYLTAVVAGRPIDLVKKLPSLGKINGPSAIGSKSPKVYNDFISVDVLARIKTMLLGQTFHQELLTLTASWSALGVPQDGVQALLYALRQLSDARDKAHPRHDRWRSLPREIDDAVHTAYAKFKPKERKRRGGLSPTRLRR